MSLYLNSDILKNQTITTLNKSKENLESAKEIIISMEIPSDFSYKNLIRQITDDIADIEKIIDKFSNYINEKIEKLENAEKNNTNVISNISVFNNIIKLDNQNIFNTTGATVKNEQEHKIFNNIKDEIKSVTYFVQNIDKESLKEQIGTTVRDDVQTFIQVELESMAQFRTEVLF